MDQYCPLSEHSAKVELNTGEKDVFRVECPACGKFLITEEAQLGLTSIVDSRLHVLLGVVRESSERGICLTITTSNIQNLLDSAQVPRDPLDSMDRILFYIQRKSLSPSAHIQLFTQTDFPIAYALVPDEFDFYLKKLVELDYLEEEPSGYFRLSVNGWRHVIEVRKNERNSNQAFVAMWFDKSLDSVWKNGFKKALEELEFNPIRIDILEHNEKICDRIIAEIRHSGLLVADFTGHRGGVYFEAGFAMGLGIPVIWTCRDTDITKAHFDTRQYNHIVWADTADLKKKLIDRIEATLGRMRRSRK